MPSPSAIAPSTSPQPAQGVRPKAPARPPGEEAADAASGGFAALLGSAMPLQEQGTVPLPAAMEAAEPAWSWSGSTALDPGRSALPGTPAGALPGAGQPPLFSGLLPPQLRRAGALVAETARMDSSALEPAQWGDPSERRPGMGGPAARPGTAPSAATALALAAQGQGRGARAVAANAAAAPGQATAHGALPAQTPAEATAMTARLEGAAGLAAALRSALDAQTLPAPAPAPAPASALATLAPAAASLGGDSAAGGRSAGQGAGAGADLSQTAAQAQSESAPAVPGSDASAAQPESASTPDAITEQMAYWATDSLQNAELTLAHDGRPVEVHVSLDGQQAHVAFRSDQSETRALLDAGTGQLRDLLGQEGLVLSGMSVGSSSAQSDAPPRPLPGRSTARKAAVAIAGGAAVVGEPLVRPGVLTQRKVDLFA